MQQVITLTPVARARYVLLALTFRQYHQLRTIRVRRAMDLMRPIVRSLLVKTVITVTPMACAHRVITFRQNHQSLRAMIALEVV